MALAIFFHIKIKKNMKKRYLIVTGGAGFVGSNLIEYLINKTNFEIISIDNYSSGTKIIILKVRG